MHRVGALALPEVVAFALSIPAQVFGHGDEQDRYSFAVCAPRADLVPSTTGFSIHAPLVLATLKSADTVIVPGYGASDELPLVVLHALQAAASRGVRVVSACTGAFAVAAAGLLDGRRASTHWRAAAELAARYPHVQVDAYVLCVDDGQVATRAGIAAGIDLRLHLVRNDHGADAAARVARRMVVAPYRDGAQAQYLQRIAPPSGIGLAGTCAWALERLADPLTVKDLARHAGWAPRTFARYCLAETSTTPLRWLTAQRLLQARRLLEVSDLSVEQIAARCGLGTAANLRLHLARDTSTTPTAHRCVYQGSSPSTRDSHDGT